MGNQSENWAEKNRLQGGPGIIEVNPNPRNGLTSKVIDLAEKLVGKLAHDSPQPLHYLASIFFPGGSRQRWRWSRRRLDPERRKMGKMKIFGERKKVQVEPVK
ncbi:unnamed protein product [Linum trigynum]|uniref:Uncharacterized protein n=1 Tax=Linum trigynum TaxID=586398 RepID=A0AAV2DUX5_9ROSI